MTTAALRAARLLILHDEGCAPHDWLCDHYWMLRELSGGNAPAGADLRCLATLERTFAAELVELG